MYIRKWVQNVSTLDNTVKGIDVSVKNLDELSSFAEEGFNGGICSSKIRSKIQANYQANAEYGNTTNTNTNTPYINQTDIEYACSTYVEK